LSQTLDLPPLVIVVGSGGVGKTTLAAALGLVSAESARTLVMTFDPSHRLKDALGVGDDATGTEVTAWEGEGGRLDASLLDARATFDRLVDRYAPDPESRDRIMANRFYGRLAGHLAGLLEYMAVERLFEVRESGQYDRIILDTPPIREALDFLEAPQRIVDFLDSGALSVALKPWFDEEGKLKVTSRLGVVGRRLDRYLDEVVGVELLRDMSEFFRAFAPLFEGFRKRADEVGHLLRSPETEFLLVAGPGEERNPDTVFFARRLEETGHRLGRVCVNRIHPELGEIAPDASEGERIFHWLADRDRRGVEQLRGLLSSVRTLVEVPLAPDEPADLQGLGELAKILSDRLISA